MLYKVNTTPSLPLLQDPKPIMVVSMPLFNMENDSGHVLVSSPPESSPLDAWECPSGNRNEVPKGLEYCPVAASVPKAKLIFS